MPVKSALPICELDVTDEEPGEVTGLAQGYTAGKLPEPGSESRTVGLSRELALLVKTLLPLQTHHHCWNPLPSVLYLCKDIGSLKMEMT